MNDETFLKDNERFKFNDITIGKQDGKRTGETSPRGAGERGRVYRVDRSRHYPSPC